MTTKRKLITAVASLGILVILAGVALGVALAALTGNVTSGFTINYTAYNVSAAISGSWGYTEDFMKTMTSNGGNKILFTGNETNGTAAQKSFDSLGNIELSATNPSVTFKYRFLNFDNSKALPISFTLDGDMENLDVNYSVKTFDGSNTTTVPGSMTDLPTTINNISVPYSGYSSYDELYEYVMGSDGGYAAMIDILKILFTQGDEAFVTAYKEFLEPQDEDDYRDIIGFYPVAAPINAFRIFLETGSEEQAFEYIDSIVLEELFPELEGYGNFELQTAIIEHRTTLYIMEELATKGRYDSAFNSSLKIVDNGFADYGTDYSYLNKDWILAYQIMKYNVLDTLYTKGYDAAIKLVDELYERNDKYFIDPETDDNASLRDESYFMNNYNSFKESLSDYVGNDALSTVEQRRAAFMADFQDLINENDIMTLMAFKEFIALAQDKLIDNVIEVSQTASSVISVPYTEITVTISLSDDADDAYLNSGNFEFVLGNV